MQLVFQNYRKEYIEDCMTIFDHNCPDFFAHNEREDYKNFLLEEPESYKVVLLRNKVVAAFGITMSTETKGRLNWIMVCPTAKGQKIGSRIMTKAINISKENGAHSIEIAASHLSAPFFSKFKAKEIKTTKDGWGIGMHKVDMEIIIK